MSEGVQDVKTVVNVSKVKMFTRARIAHSI